MDWPRIDGHTPYPWTRAEGLTAGGVVSDKRTPGSVYVAQAHGRDDPNEFEANAELLTLVSPHLCDVPDCPGPKLVARLEEAGKTRERLHEACAATGTMTHVNAAECSAQIVNTIAKFQARLEAAEQAVNYLRGPNLAAGQVVTIELRRLMDEAVAAYEAAK